ncbi:hypothetical protein D3C80_1864070 [compost metagenome]
MVLLAVIAVGVAAVTLANRVDDFRRLGEAAPNPGRKHRITAGDGQPGAGIGQGQQQHGLAQGIPNHSVELMGASPLMRDALNEGW